MKTLERSEVFVFLIAIVAINALFVGAVARDFLPDGVYNYGRFVLLAMTMAVVVYVFRGRRGIAKLLAPLTKWKTGLHWYLFALIWPPLMGIAVLLGTGGLNAGTEFNWDLVLRPGVLVPVFIGALIGEIVWVSYAIRRLSGMFPVFVACLIVGAFWTAWWLPMTYFDYGIIPGLEPLPLLINQTGVALVCGLLYYITRSGPCVLLLQFNVNMSILVVPVLPTTGGETVYWTFAITYFLAAVGLFALIGPKPLFARSKDFATT